MLQIATSKQPAVNNNDNIINALLRLVCIIVAIAGYYNILSHSKKPKHGTHKIKHQPRRTALPAATRQQLVITNNHHSFKHFYASIYASIGNVQHTRTREANAHSSINLVLYLADKSTDPIRTHATYCY
jgi:hypothetical protein